MGNMAVSFNDTDQSSRYRRVIDARARTVGLCAARNQRGNRKTSQEHRSGISYRCQEATNSPAHRAAYQKSGKISKRKVACDSDVHVVSMTQGPR